jgi:hypothetical protein
MKKLIAALAFTVAAAAMAAPSVAQPQGDYRYQGGGNDQDGLNLRGLSVKVAQSQLANSGFSPARSMKVNGQQYDLWSNSRSRQGCIGFTSYNGGVTDVRGFDDSDCGVYNNGGGGWGGGGYDSSDIRGQSVKSAQASLRSRGYTNTRNINFSDQQWDLWLSDRGRDCVGFTSYKGRVTDTRSFRNSECGGNGDYGNGGWGSGFRAPDRLIGQSVKSAQITLANAGFGKARSINLRGKQWDLWYDDRGRGGRCVGFTSYKGTVSDADTFDDGDCY